MNINFSPVFYSDIPLNDKGDIDANLIYSRKLGMFYFIRLCGNPSRDYNAFTLVFHFEFTIQRVNGPLKQQMSETVMDSHSCMYFYAIFYVSCKSIRPLKRACKHLTTTFQNREIQCLNMPKKLLSNLFCRILTNSKSYKITHMK